MAMRTAFGAPVQETERTKGSIPGEEGCNFSFFFFPRRRSPRPVADEFPLDTGVDNPYVVSGIAVEIIIFQWKVNGMIVHDARD